MMDADKWKIYQCNAFLNCQGILRQRNHYLFCTSIDQCNRPSGTFILLGLLNSVDGICSSSIF